MRIAALQTNRSAEIKHIVHEDAHYGRPFSLPDQPQRQPQPQVLKQRPPARFAAPVTREIYSGKSAAALLPLQKPCVARLETGALLHRAGAHLFLEAEAVLTTNEILILLMGCLTVLLLAAVWRSWTLKTDLDRLNVRLDEQARQSESLAAQLARQARETDDVVRNLDRDLREQSASSQQALISRIAEARQDQSQALSGLRETLTERFGDLRQGFEQRQAEALRMLQESSQQASDRLADSLVEALARSSGEMGKRMDSLAQSTDRRLNEISGQVEKRLSEGFEKTTATFNEVRERLLLIDQAQKNIEELSGNVVSLQEVLADRSSRGTFGEVQLEALVRNVLPENGFRLQYTLSNGARADCMLFLPQPTGNVPIDSKFPLENYRRKSNPDLPDAERKAAGKQYIRDVRTHMQDIASKYLLPGETSNGAVMFIPAEAVFADVHAHYPELVEEGQRLRVWLASPTTLMAILTTAGAVLKDAATREQVHLLKEHLDKLGEDFRRFEARMENLSRHIRQAHEDVDAVNISARKITGRFGRIQRLELGDGEPDERQSELAWSENAEDADGEQE